MSIYDFEKVIKTKMSEMDLLEAAEEETTELLLAIQKMRRIIKGNSPTPVTYAEARENMLEEVADVRLTAEMLMKESDFYTVSETMMAKKARWAYRLVGGTKHEKEV